MATFKDKLALLKQLADGAKIFDVHGVPVSPRTKDEIMWHPQLLELVTELEILGQRRFARLTKEYRDLQYRIRFMVEGILAKWCDDLVENIQDGTWILQTEEEQKEAQNA